MALSTTAAKINERNREYWRVEQAETDRLLSDAVVVGQAVGDLESEARRGVPVYHQKTLEVALRDAEQRKKDVQQQQARRGGTVKKTDALQALIIELVRKAPSLTGSALLERLRTMQGGGVVDDIADGTISFHGRDGRIKDAPISGLKDRLSRARKILRSR
jgi:hypothetical protein